MNSKIYCLEWNSVPPNAYAVRNLKEKNGGGLNDIWINNAEQFPNLINNKNTQFQEA